VAHAVCTVTLGAAYHRLAALTHPSLGRYAARLGAHFVVIDRRAWPEHVPLAYEKLQVARLLGEYDRVLLIDSDVLVRPDAPSLFDVVAPTHFGVLNEQPWFPTDVRARIGRACSELGVALPDFDWDHRYFQTGVMVLSRIHAPLFAPPKTYFRDHPWEQSWLNILIAARSVPVHELPWRYNRIGCMDRRLDEPRDESYIIHYAGSVPGMAYGFGHAFRPGENLFDLIRRDAAAWDG
jgi:hypothetical protein